VGVKATSVDSPFEAFLAKGLRAIGRERWQESFQAESGLLDLALALASKNAIGLTSAFADALLWHAEGLLAGNVARPTRLIESWGRFPKMLTRNGQKTFFRNIRDVLLSDPSRGVDALIGIYAEGLITSRVLEDQVKADDVVRRLLKALVDRRVPAEIRWATEVLQGDPNLLANSEAASVGVLRDAVTVPLLEPDLAEDVQVAFASLADRLGVVLPRVAAKETTPEPEG
jgi:hypothetical protein